MNPEKNLHARVPPALLTEMERVAAVEHITLDELVKDAVELRLNKREWQEVLAFGERHAKARGLTESDVEDAITAVRSETQERRR